MNIGELMSDKDISYLSAVNMYSKRMYTTCSEEELLRLIHTDITGEIGAIPPLWADLIYYFSKSEPENLFISLRDIIGAFLERDYSNQMHLGNLKGILSANGFENLFRFVDINVRNAISHGRVVVSPWDVLFVYTQGKTKQEREKTWTIRDIFGETAYALLGAGEPHFDDFIEGSFDDAGGIIVGFFRFFSRHPEVIEKNLEDIQSDEYLSREYLSMPSSWSCEPTDSAVILSYVSIACA